jgi:GT2 family glycosyltransferase
VIASRIGGIPEVVHHERNGLLVEPGDVEDLRRAVSRVLREPGLVDRLRAGIGPVPAIEDDVARTRALYGRLTGGDRARAGRRQDPAGARRIAAVVLNYRTPDDTYLAVRSLLASRRPLDDIVVVNNDAPGGPQAAYVPPSVRHIDTGRNLGFSGGINVGIRAALGAGADAVLLVNSDVVLPPDCLASLERAIDDTRDHAPRGIVAPLVASRSAPGVVATQGIDYNPRTGRMRHRGVATRRSAPDGHQRCGDCPVDAVSACAVLVRRDVFDAIGLFDEDYFFSFEDLDFCLRARHAGFETMLVGGATAYHEGGRTIGAQAPERLYFAARNHLLVASRRTPARSRVGHACRISSIVLLNLVHALIADGPSLPRRLAAVLRGTWDYALGRYGDPRASNHAR